MVRNDFSPNCIAVSTQISVMRIISSNGTAVVISRTCCIAAQACGVRLLADHLFDCGHALAARHHAINQTHAKQLLGGVQIAFKHDLCASCALTRWHMKE